MRAVDDLIEQAKRLPPEARRELRDRLDESLDEKEEPAEEQVGEGLYASLLKIAGTAHSKYPDVSANKNKHLAEIFARRSSTPAASLSTLTKPIRSATH
jgi:hypothetical protein